MSPMSPLRRWCALALVLAPALLLAPASGQTPRPAERKGDDKAEKWLVDRALTVTPAAAPVPALKYRLFPLTLERKEGNAVPMYLRFVHERNDEWKKYMREKPAEWNRLPREKLPLEEVKKLLKGYA